MYKEIQKGAVEKSCMRKGFLIHEEMRQYLVIYEEAVSHIMDFLIQEENFVFIFNSVEKAASSHLHDVLLAGLEDVEVAAALGRSHQVLQEACEHPAVVSAGLGNREHGLRVRREDLEVLGVVDGEAVAVPLDDGVGLAAEGGLEDGRLALFDADGLQGVGEVGRRHVLLHTIELLEDEKRKDWANGILTLQCF
jgi:hypothetical protein